MPLGLSVNPPAKALNVPTPWLNDVVRERRGLSTDSAMRLARYFGGDARTWLHLQAAYDLRVAEIANAKRVTKGSRSSGRGSQLKPRLAANGIFRLRKFRPAPHRSARTRTSCRAAAPSMSATPYG